MKDRLNEIKGRAYYRPVAPLCIESRAREVFDPGTQDPYMLFEHRVRANWVDRVPAIVHSDGSARLQTISPSETNTVAGHILYEYERIGGIPVLCNTSANCPGRGFSRMFGRWRLGSYTIRLGERSIVFKPTPSLVQCILRPYQASGWRKYTLAAIWTVLVRALPCSDGAGHSYQYAPPHPCRRSKAPSCVCARAACRWRVNMIVLCGHVHGGARHCRSVLRRSLHR